MRRLLHVVVAALVLPLLLTGCQSDKDRYCGAVKSHESDLGSVLNGGGHDALIKALPIFEDLRDKAPDDIRDSWSILITAIGGLRDVLKAAGVDAATYNRDQPPAGVTQAQRDAIDAAAAKLTQPATVEAFGDVQQEALDVCQIPLNL